MIGLLFRARTSHVARHLVAFGREKRKLVEVFFFLSFFLWERVFCFCFLFVLLKKILLAFVSSTSRNFFLTQKADDT